ncbi:MAG: glycosyl hydrolase [Verrucomicrobiae bacterium]|nr:glycosyl hydrolase [Verrucomicrobiae bacterium]
MFALIAPAPLKVRAQPGTDPLLNGFNHPPLAARPRTWWHWTGGNVTKEGVTKDLEWMEHIGLAGFQLADVAVPGDQTADKKIQYGTPETVPDGPARRTGSATARASDSNLQLARVEPDQRGMGQARAGHEKTRLERDKT